METLAAYIPLDRRQALARGQDLPDRAAGAALFADISGFTPLTEALVRALGPRRGAEELTRQLNAVYDALIAAADRYGGSVIGFAGDAITCWFDDKIGRQASRDACRRAAACGLAMQQAMGSYASIAIPSSGTVALALKVAVASGPARRFLVGDPQIQVMDVLAGATVQRMAAGERQATQGEVVLDAPTAERLGAAARVAEWRTDAETGASFAVLEDLAQSVIVAPVSDPSLPLAVLSEDQIRPWVLPPVYERLQSGQGDFLAELRSVVTLFLRFGAIDYDGDDAAGAQLDAYVRHVQRILTRRGGALLQVIIGDKGSYLYAAFGAPIAHDDDAVRAVTAALDLCAPLAGADGTGHATDHAMGHLSPVARDVQIGISRGRMRVGAYGSTTRRTYGALGDEANVSARLMGTAAPGQILVGQHVADAVARHVELEPVGSLALKGKTKPIVVSRVRGRRSPSVQRPATLYAHPLVGRDPELERVAQVVEATLSGEGQILRLEGAAGVGKSHLAAELVERSLRRGLQVIVAGCQSATQETAYAPWRQVFCTVLGLANAGAAGADPDAASRHVDTLEAAAMRLNPDWLLRLPLLGDLLGVPIPDNPTTTAMEPQLRRGALLDLAVEIVQRSARQQPMLLLIDDVHWMDEASQQVTVALSRVVGRVPLLLALAHRPPLPGTAILPDLDDLPCQHRLGLDELTPAGVAALLAHRLDGEPTPLTLSLILAQTHGNPFFVEEMVDTLRESGRLERRADGHWDLSAALVTRLRQAGCLVRTEGEWVLAPDASLAAVELDLPDSIEGMVLSRIDRLPETAKLTLRVASVIGRTFALDVLARAHPLHADMAALEGQLATLQTRDFARLEEAGPRPRYLFKHNITYEVAYDTFLFSQRRQLHRAVGEALEDVEPEAAPQLAHHAYMGEDWPRALRYQLAAGRRAQRLFATHEGIAHLEKALQSAQRLPAGETVAQRQEAHLTLGEFLTATGQYEPALEHLGASLALAEERGDRDAQACACRWFARLYELRSDYPLALQWIARVLDALDGRETADAAEAVITAGLIHTRRGDYGQALAQALQGQRIAKSAGEASVAARALGLLGIVYRLQGNMTQSLLALQQALAGYTEAENVHGQGMVHNELGVALSVLGHWTEAVGHYHRAREIFDQIGERYRYALATNNLGAIARQQGRLAEALRLFDDGEQALRQAGGSPYLMGLLEMNLGETFIRQGDAAPARQRLRNSQDYFDRAGARDFLPALHALVAETALLAGNVSAAAAEARHSHELAREMDQRYDVGNSLRALGQVAVAQGDPQSAARYLGESAAMLHELGEQYDEGRSQLWLARASLQLGEVAPARAALDRCVAIFEQLGAALDLAAARALEGELLAVS